MKIMLVARPAANETRPVSQTLVAATLVVGHLAYGACVAVVLAGS